MVGVQSAFITVPVNIILVALFRSIKMKEPVTDTKPDIENGTSEDEGDDVFAGQL